MAALPSGSDPDFFDLGNFGMVGAGLGGLLGRTQDNVMDFLRIGIQGSSSWGGASGHLFDGLFPDGETPFPVLFLSAIMEQILGFVPGATTVIELLVDLGGFFTGKWLSLDSFAEILSDAVTFILSFLDPVGLLFSNGSLLDAFDFFSWPFTFGDDWDSNTTNPIAQFVRNFTRFFPWMADFDFDTSDSATHLTTNKLLPTGTVAPLIDNVLPDEFAPPIIGEALQAGINAAGGIADAVIGSTPIVGAWFDAILGHRTATTSAQGSADSANARNIIQDAALAGQQVINGGGTATIVSDEFDRIARDDLAISDTTSNWNQRRTLNDGGASGVDGSGNAIWDAGGSQLGEMVNRYSASALSTDTTMAAFTLENGIGSATLQNPELSLILRCNSTSTTYIEARIHQQRAQIGYMVDDAYVMLGTFEDVTHTPGDSWEFRAGNLLTDAELAANPTAVPERKFVLLQNGLTKVTRIDTGAASLIGAGYRYAGFKQFAGQSYFWIPFQKAPNAIKAWSAADRVAA